MATYGLIPGGGGDPVGVASDGGHMVALSNPRGLAERLEAFRRGLRARRRR